MNDTAEAKKVKDRSPTFPFITLERALDRARQFYAEEKRGVAPYSRAVLHWKYSESSSGGQQTLGALKNYGLLSEPTVAGNKGRHVQVTELALRILLDQRPDSTERAQYIREAAMKPAIAAEIYEKWPESLPQDATLNHFLVLEKKFTPDSAVRAVKILKENHALARIGEMDLESVASDNEQATETGETVQIQVPDPTKPATFTGHQPKVTVGKPTPFTEQLLSLDGKVTTTLHFSDTPSAGVYDWIASYARSKSDALKAVEKARPTGESGATTQ